MTWASFTRRSSPTRTSGRAYSIAKGLHNFGVANFSVLGDHFSPIDALLAPLIWIYNSPVDLLVAQGVLFALAIPFIWSFTRTAFGGGRLATIGAYCVSLAYAISWPIAGAAAFNYHEVAFAPVLTAITFERLQKGKWRTAVIAMVALLLVKEDMGFFLAGIGAGLTSPGPSGSPASGASAWCSSSSASSTRSPRCTSSSRPGRPRGLLLGLRLARPQCSLGAEAHHRLPGLRAGAARQAADQAAHRA